MNASGSRGVLLGKGAVMRSYASGRRDRVLAAIEIPALGIWLGALVGFAFVTAPLTFRIVAPLDVGRFAVLIAATLGQLTMLGYFLGGIALVAAIVRARYAGDRTWDVVRILLIAIALGLATFEERAIVPAMQRITNVASPQYHALHARSSQIYGAVVLLDLAALVLVALRRDEE
jgi:hypothetical protein